MGFKPIQPNADLNPKVSYGLKNNPIATSKGL